MLVWWLCVSLCCITSSLGRETNLIPKKSIAIDENAKLVIFGTRHGNRHPGKFLNENPRVWGFEGDYELTQFGKREGFGFGKELREFIGPLVSNNYVRHEAAFYTSSANRCQMTLQVIMAGFYPPDTFAEWNHALEWSPVPYSIDDPMLRLYSIQNCSTSQRAWEPISDDNLPELAAITAANAPLLGYIAKHTGWNGSIESATDLADNILEIDLYNTSLPEWIERPTLEGFDKRSLKEAIMTFMEKHSLTCVDYEPCRDITAGTWLHHILTTLRNVADGQQSQKFVGYVSHLEVTLSVMRLMRINQTYLDTSAGFLVEYRDKPQKSVRLLVHEASATDRHIIQQANYLDELKQLSDWDQWIPLDSFFELVKDKAIADWEEACGRKVAQCRAPDDVDAGEVPVQEFDTDSGTLADNRTTSSASSLTSHCYILMNLFIFFVVFIM